MLGEGGQVPELAFQISAFEENQRSKRQKIEIKVKET